MRLVAGLDLRSITSAPSQHLGNGFLPQGPGDVLGRFTLLVPERAIGAGVEQNADDLRLPLACCNHESRIALVVLDRSEERRVGEGGSCVVSTGTCTN